LIWPRLRSGRAERAAAAGGALIALATTPFVPSGVPIILAAPAALAVAWATRGRAAGTAAGDTEDGDAAAGGATGGDGAAGDGAAIGAAAGTAARLRGTGLA